jgi:hypothetical protein
MNNELKMTLAALARDVADGKDARWADSAVALDRARLAVQKAGL